jgi:hypothetical protein
MRKYGEVDTATIVAVDREAQRLVIRTFNGPEVIQVEEATRIVRDGDSVSLASLEIGQRVVVEARHEASDGVPRLIADRVVVVVAAGASGSP